jgi:putative transposase
MRVTIKVKINPIEELKDINSKYLRAVQYCVTQSALHDVKHKFELHNLIYKEIRQKFGLKSQFAINCIAKGFESYKSSKKLKGRTPQIKSAPIIFDKRLSSFKGDSIRLATNKKRIDVPLNIADYYSKYSDWEYQTCMLINKKGISYLNITFSKDIQPDKCNSQITSVGVDVGVNNLAVCSDGKVFKGHKTRIMQHNYLRKKLQRKGTKSAKRLLQKLSGKQKRYMCWVNHNVSKEIVSSADEIILEDLKGIRKNKKGKHFNRWLNSWSFYQLQTFIDYKAELVGKTVTYVNPYMTSQTCSNCSPKIGEVLGSRYYDSFSCSHCGFSCQSDLNASYNLRRLSVMQPYSPNVDVKGNLATATEFRAKSPVL